MSRAVQTPLQDADEFQEFKTFFVLLKTNYSSSLDAIIQEISEEDFKQLMKGLFIRKVQLLSLNPNKPAKYDYRKIYNIKRLDDYLLNIQIPDGVIIDLNRIKL